MGQQLGSWLLGGKPVVRSLQSEYPHAFRHGFLIQLGSRTHPLAQQ